MPTKVDWQSWARQMALGAAITMSASGVVSILVKAPLMFLGYYSLAIGVIIYLWEYPIPGFDWCGPVKTNFYIRGIGYMALAAPSALQAATISPAIFLFFSAIWYIRAGFVGEVWTHPNARGGGEDGGGGGGGRGGGRGRGDKKEDVKSIIAAPGAAMYTPPSGNAMRQPAYDSYDQPANIYQQPPRQPATPPMPQAAPRRASPVPSSYGPQGGYPDGRSTPPLARRPSNPYGNGNSNDNYSAPPPQPYGGGRQPYGAPQPGYGAPAPGYGAPQQYQQPYAAPQPNYGAPQPNYGAPQPNYGMPPPRGRPNPPNRPAPPY